MNSVPNDQNLSVAAVLRRLRLMISPVLILIIFLLDTFTPLVSAVAVFYVVPLLMLGDFLSIRRVQLLFFGMIGLATFSLLFDHGLNPEFATLLRYCVSIAAISITGFLLVKTIRDRQTLIGQAALLDVTHDAIFTRSPDGRILFWNRGAERLYGWSRQEAVGRSSHELLQSQFPTSLEAINAHLHAHGLWEGEISHQCRDGGRLIVLSRWTLDDHDPGKPPVILESNTDVTASKAADAALRDSEVRYRNIFNTLAVGIWEHDFGPLRAALKGLRESGVEDMHAYLLQHPEFVRDAQQMIPITDVNDTALKLMDVERKEDFFRSLSEILPPEEGSFIDFLIAFDEGRGYYQAETEVLNRRGETIPIIVAITFPPPGDEADRVQAVVLNITERRRLQLAFDHAKQEAEQALRAAAMGELSVSIAHEVNQPLAAIMTSSEAALRWMDRSPPDLEETREALTDVLNATRHATGVVKRVRKLVSRTRPETEAVAVNALAVEALRLVRHDLERLNIPVRVALAAADGHVQADRVLLQQALVNLVTNAAQAMTAAGTPAPTIEMRTCLKDGHAVIDVIDNGPGFDPDSAQRAFDAFFSTRPDGMGLGLAICRSTVEAHEGTVSIVSEPGAGARLSICLPLLSDPPGA
ncbi:MAG: PAS domain S-box protein [Brevundimonas sp.]|uniref:PAS domain-containing sensor histidine kinase n=1 Tax=Brevundimonas sp. TaxID=1871086 RepID=UPI00256BEFFC|nr:ATP-binding protein [Brevundimonas sp.]MDK2748427.1 PAS domain S-box protein [Brevundimonas sp.]